MTDAGRIGVLVVNFGEPDDPTPDKVEPFLERIFLLNAGLEPHESARERARSLARDRAPGLIEEYESIGGSPLNRQADEQALRLEEALRDRGLDVRTYSSFQFTAPLVTDRLREAYDGEVDTLVVLPVYPLCGRSTTVAGLDAVKSELDELDWAPEVAAVSGWHRDAAYTALRADHIRSFVESEGIDLQDADTLLYFSAHGTPVKYLDEGNRYDRYVEEHCRDVANRLGVERYGVGFQNHTNRRIAWTQPDNQERIFSAPETTLVVVPISFMHEQSETLAELDGDLREFAEGLGKKFFRVPVPHDDPRFDSFLADLVERLVDGSAESDTSDDRGPLSRCHCAPGAWCTNGSRELPPSPYV